MFWFYDTIMIFTPSVVILWSECEKTAEIRDQVELPVSWGF